MTKQTHQTIVSARRMPRPAARRAWVYAGLAVSMMVLIFVMSSADGNSSSQMSGPIVGYLERFIPVFDSLYGAAYEGAHQLLSWFVRKGAHFTGYAFIGFFWAAAFHAWQSPASRTRGHLARGFGIALLIGVCYAGTDELHQMFVAGRAAMLMDVGFDGAGAFTGALLATLFAGRVRHIPAEKNDETQQ